MKKNLFIFTSLVIISCSEKDVQKEVAVRDSATPPYDTIAIDSFSKGAASANIAKQIKISSQQYQDSLKDVLKKMEAEKLLKKDESDKEKAQKLLEAEKKKNEETKLKKDNPKKDIQISPIENIATP